MKLRLLVLGLSLFVVAVFAFGGARQADGPTDVRQARELLLKWLNGFNGKDPAAVARLLDTPVHTSNWNFDGKAELLLRSQPPGGGLLEFYCVEGRVVTASLLLLSE